MKKRILFIILISLSIISCDFILGVDNLGNGYYFDTDQILYTEKNSYDGIGYAVIPPKVISYSETEKLIIVTSKNNKGIIYYWIILKKDEKKELFFMENNDEFNSYYAYSNVKGPFSEEEYFEKQEIFGVPKILSVTIIE